MLISNQTTYTLGSTMETFKGTITPVRKNVARKSTANRPLKPVSRTQLAFTDNSALFLEFDNVDSHKNNHLTNLDSGRHAPVKNFTTETVKSKLDAMYLNRTVVPQENSKYLDESDEDCNNIDGVFSISSSMLKYLRESQLSPSISEDSDDSFDGHGVLNYPVEFEFNKFVEKEFVPCYGDEFPYSDNESDTSISDRTSDVKCNLNTKVVEEEPVLSVSEKVPVIKKENCTEVSSVNSVDAVNCGKDVLRVSEEVVKNENKSATLTINGNEVTSSEPNNCSATDTQNDSLKIEFITTLFNNDLWADTSESIENDPKEDEPAIQKEAPLPAVNEGKIQKRKYKKSKPVFSYKKRKTRNSNKNDTNKIIENIEDNTITNKSGNLTKVDKNMRGATKPQLSPKSVKGNITKIKQCKNKKICSIESSEPDLCANAETEINESSELPPDKDSKTEEDLDKTKNLESKKCEKKKKEINEGVLLHVEAAKKTNIMRDGKILKDKKDLLKDIESKIESNQPVEVDKEFDIQQSLTEEILLDQALRLAHQRTSPRRKPLLTTSQAKALINSLTSRKTRSQSADAKNSNSSDSLAQQKSASDKDITDDESSDADGREYESSDNGKQNSGVDQQVSANSTKSERLGKKQGVKKYTKTRNSKSLKRMIKNLTSGTVDMDELSKTCSEVINSMNDIGNAGSADQSDSDIIENKKAKTSKNKLKKLSKRKTSKKTFHEPSLLDQTEELVPVIIIKNKNEAFLRKRTQSISKLISSTDNTNENDANENTGNTKSSNNVTTPDEDPCSLTSTGNGTHVKDSENLENNNEVNLINLDATCVSLVIDDSLLNDSLLKSTAKESINSPNLLSPSKEDQKPENKSNVSNTKDTPLVIEDSPESPDNNGKTIDDDVIEITDMEVDSPQKGVGGSKEDIFECELTPEISNKNSLIPFLDGSDSVTAKTNKNSCSGTAVMSIITKSDNDNEKNRLFASNSLPSNEPLLTTFSHEDLQIPATSSESTNYLKIHQDQRNVVSNAPATMSSIYGKVPTYSSASSQNSSYSQHKLSGNISNVLTNQLENTIIGNNQTHSVQLNQSLLPLNMSAGVNNVSPVSTNNFDPGASGSHQQTSSLVPTSLYPTTFTPTNIVPSFTPSTAFSNQSLCSNIVSTTSEVNSFLPTTMSYQSLPHIGSTTAYSIATGTAHLTTAVYSSSVLQQVSQQNAIPLGGNPHSHTNTSVQQISTYMNKSQSTTQYPHITPVQYSSSSEATQNSSCNTQASAASSHSNTVNVSDRPAVSKEEPKSKGKVVDVPLSILFRDPRLRRRNLRIILDDVEFNASALKPAAVPSNSISPSTAQEPTSITKSAESVISNLEDDSNSKDDDDDDNSEGNIPEEETRNDSEMNKLDSDNLTHKKRPKKKEVDKELLYKTPLCDLHEETPDRSSYSRKPPRKPPRYDDSRQPELEKKAEKPMSFNKHHDPYRESTDSNSPQYYNQVPNTSHCDEEVTSEYPPAYSTNSTNFRRVGPGPERVKNHHRYEEFPQHSRRPDHFSKRRPEEYTEGRRGREFPDRRPLLEQPFSRTNQRYQDYSTESHSEFHTDYRHHKKSNHYSRWDYAHKKVDGKFPINSDLTDYNSGSRGWVEDNETRDLLEGPVHSLGHPYSRRRGASFQKPNYARGIEAPDRDLFERRWEAGGDERMFRRPYRDRSPIYDHKWVDRAHGPGRGPDPSTVPLDSPMSPDQEPVSYNEPVKYLSIPQ